MKCLIKKIAILGALIAAIALMFAHSTTHVSIADVNDFGAETIEDEPPIIPLPVDLVEETAEPEQVSAIDRNLIDPKTGESTTANDDSETATALADIDEKAIGGLFSANDIEIAALIKGFGKITGRNYILDDDVKGKVTIHLQTPPTTPEAMKIFDAVLFLKGFTTVPIGENIWKVIKSKDAKQTTIPIMFEAPDVTSDVLITRLIRLKHVPANDLQQVVSQFVSGDGTVSSFEGTNSLILIDSSANIERLNDLVLKLDVPATDQDITIIPIEHAEAADLAEKINEILGDEAESSTKTSPAMNNLQTAQAVAAARAASRRNTGGATSEDTKRRLPLKIIPDERTNSIIVVADPELTTKVRGLVEQLDSPLDRSAGRFWVYRLKYADAEELAEILNSVISGAGEVEDRASAKTRGSTLTRSSARNSEGRSGSATNPAVANQLINQRVNQAMQNRAARLGSQTADGGRVTFEGEVTIAPDPSTNALIVNASRTDYLRVREVIDLLDVKRRQVLVEATILEVTITDEEGVGIEFQGSTSVDGDSGGVVAQTNFGGLTNLLTNPAALSDLTIAAASSGTLTLPGGLVIPSQSILVTALSRLSNVNVLSSPTIVATDNEEAEIIVGENVPFVTSTSTDPANLNNTFNSIERQDVGITLRLTPQISAGDFVGLRIFVEISNVVQGTRNDPNGPTTTIRTTETSVSVKNNQMVVTGGLLADQFASSTRGVPYLKDIPVLGHFFKRQDDTQRRTNLLVFITPRIIEDQYGARERTIQMRDKLDDRVPEDRREPLHETALHSSEIDQVVSELPLADDAVLPTTVTAPETTRTGFEPVDSDKARDALERTQARFKQLAETQQKMSANTNIAENNNSAEPGFAEAVKDGRPEDEVLDVKVRPKLPGEKDIPPAKPSAEATPEDEHSLDEKSMEQTRGQLRPSSGTARTYVVLREISSGDSPSPFPYADGNKTIGLTLIGDINSTAGSFFQAGGRFTYNTNDGPRSFVCLGKYQSPAAAGAAHGSLQNSAAWHQLSPSDVLLLGKRGWLQG